LRRGFSQGQGTLLDFSSVNTGRKSDSAAKSEGVQTIVEVGLWGDGEGRVGETRGIWLGDTWRDAVVEAKMSLAAEKRKRQEAEERGMIVAAKGNEFMVTGRLEVFLEEKKETTTCCNVLDGKKRVKGDRGKSSQEKERKRKCQLGKNRNTTKPLHCWPALS